MVRLAISMENVLADVNGAFLECYNERADTDYTLQDVSSPEWFDDLIGHDEFVLATNRMWVTKSHLIDPVETGLGTTLTQLTHTYGTVDLVTERQGVEEAMIEWLEKYNITDYNKFVTIPEGESKADYDYDCYIDHDPTLPEELSDEQFQFMVAKPWNKGRRSTKKSSPIELLMDVSTSL